MMDFTHIGLLGSQGRMGTRVSHLLDGEFAKVARLTAHANQGDPLEDLLKTDVVIDFSSPSGMATLARKAMKVGGPLPAFVVGSTGWKPEEHEALEVLATQAPVLVSFNFSTGILLLAEILKTASPLFSKLGYTPVIVETHHCHKKDSPSGTALLLQRSIQENSSQPIQTHSIRAGEIIGDHAVNYYGPADTITLSHHAMDRTIFARGAIDVALWLAKKYRGDRGLKGFIEIESFFQDLKESSL